MVSGPENNSFLSPIKTKKINHSLSSAKDISDEKIDEVLRYIIVSSQRLSKVPAVPQKRIKLDSAKTQHVDGNPRDLSSILSPLEDKKDSLEDEEDFGTVVYLDPYAERRKEFFRKLFAKPSKETPKSDKEITGSASTGKEDPLTLEEVDPVSVKLCTPEQEFENEEFFSRQKLETKISDVDEGKYKENSLKTQDSISCEVPTQILTRSQSKIIKFAEGESISGDLGNLLTPSANLLKRASKGKSMIPQVSLKTRTMFDKVFPKSAPYGNLSRPVSKKRGNSFLTQG
jgi:hypothetical protein